MPRARLGVVLTDGCNLRCTYCCVQEKRGGQLAWAVLRQTLDALLHSSADALEITFTGGEPLLAFATLRRAVAYVERRSAARRTLLRVLTNGLLLEGHRLAFLDAHRFLVNLSFDGVPAAQSLRGRATHARLDHLLNQLQERYPALFRDRLKLCLTLTPATIPYLADSVAYFLEKGVRSFAVTPATGNVAWPLQRIEELDRQFERLTGDVLRHYQQTGRVPFVLFRKSVSEQVVPMPGPACDAIAAQVLVIDVDGTAYACLPATRTYQRTQVAALRPALEALRLGSSATANAETRRAAMQVAARAADVFEHAEQRYSAYKRCARCEFLGRCRICPLAQSSSAAWDDLYRVSDFLCAFNQVALAYRDRFPAQPTAYDFLSGKVPLSALHTWGESRAAH